MIILDCCYAANAARDTAVGTTKELLAACGRENPTTGVGVRSFTSALIEELKAFGTAPFTIAMLHGRLVTMRWRLAFTPIYALLSEHGGQSVQLSPLPLPLPLLTESVQMPPIPESSYSTSSQQSSSGIAADTRVLLAVSIAGDATPDVCQWKQWLVSQAPPEITSIDAKVEGVFQSHSTMLVTSIPVHAWDGLPERAAYRFVGFVKSENRIGIGASNIPQKQSVHESGLSVAKPRPSSLLEPDLSSSHSAEEEAYSASMRVTDSAVSNSVSPFVPLSASTAFSKALRRRLIRINAPYANRMRLEKLMEEYGAF